MLKNVVDGIKKQYKPALSSNYNRIIDIYLNTKQGKQVEIKTPRYGRKPQISISGKLGMDFNASEFEVRITNLYSDSILSGLTSIDVFAGYADNLSFAISGSVANVFTEKPAPDKVTVIQCITAQYESWFNKTAKIEFKSSFSVKDFIDKVSSALGFDSAIIDSDIIEETFNAPFSHNGRIVDAIRKYNKAVGINDWLVITPINGRLRVFKASANGRHKGEAYSSVHTLNLLSQVPQFSGGVVNLVLPWIPTIKPGDLVQFPAGIAKTSIGALQYNKAVVDTVSFNFSTIGKENQMIIMGTPEGQ